MFSRDAFREIVLNAIVHKDYSSCNPIQISVYPDKIYVWNNGNMPKNLDSAEKLFDKHSSEPFNPNLAQVFFKSGLIEAWGRGFDKIRAGCEEYGGELPAYEILENGIMVLCKACPSYLEMLKSDTMTGSEGKAGRGKKVAEKHGEVAEKVAEKINETESRIIALIRSDAHITQKMLSEAIGLTRQYIGRRMDSLQTRNIIRRVGPAKGGHWEVVG